MKFTPRREHRWPTKVPWAERQLAKLAEHGPVVAKAALRQSMSNAWQGVFPEKVSGESSAAVPTWQETPEPTYRRCSECGEHVYGAKDTRRKHEKECWA